MPPPLPLIPPLALLAPASAPAHPAGGPLFEPGLILYREHTAAVGHHHVAAGGAAWDTIKPLHKWFTRLHR